MTSLASTKGIRIEWIRIETMRIEGICIEWIRIEMMLIDMHGMIYANTLQKNPATKRLSGKK